MAGCLDCDAPCQGARCEFHAVEHNAPELSLDDHECPDCGGRTSGEGVRCAACRNGGDA